MSMAIALLSSCIFFLRTHADPIGVHTTALTPALSDTDLVAHRTDVTAPRYAIQCSEEYGTGLDLRDCENAISHIRFSRNMNMFVDRDDPGRTRENIVLPYRLMGIANDIALILEPDAARCFIQPILIPGAHSAEASHEEIKRAAEEISRKCGFFRYMGGVISNIGGDNNLAVILGRYEPMVTCLGRLPALRSCATAIHNMEVSTEDLVFGRPSSPHTQVGIPAQVDADMGGGNGDILDLREEWQSRLFPRSWRKPLFDCQYDWQGCFTRRSSSEPNPGVNGRKHKSL
ncbi:MAG: hypothetical protein Q9209_007610 [Squamulea sp. 1 TL-2023]